MIELTAKTEAAAKAKHRGYEAKPTQHSNGALANNFEDPQSYMTKPRAKKSDTVDDKLFHEGMDGQDKNSNAEAADY